MRYIILQQWIPAAKPRAKPTNHYTCFYRNPDSHLLSGVAGPFHAYAQSYAHVGSVVDLDLFCVLVLVFLSGHLCVNCACDLVRPPSTFSSSNVL